MTAADPPATSVRWQRRAQAALLASFTASALLPLLWMVSRPTLANYVSLLRHSDFPLYFSNSLVVSIATALLTGVLAASAGYALSRFRFRGRSWVIAIMLAAQMCPLVIIVAPVFRLLAPLGLTNSLTGLIIVYTAFNIPFATFLMQYFIDAVPKDLEEAAMLDGATRPVAALRIVLPLTLPGLAATLGFVFIAAWSELLFALMLNSSNAASTFPVGLLGFIARSSADFGRMTAAGSLALIPVCMIFLCLRRHLSQGLTAGAMRV
jgi:multiple sugar transport system permease protein